MHSDHIAGGRQVTEQEFLALELLQEVRVSVLAEYLAKRLDLAAGECTLQFDFVQGRYERMRRYAALSRDG